MIESKKQNLAMFNHRLILLAGLLLFLLPAFGILPAAPRQRKPNIDVMVLIPAGPFIMGSPDVENEAPAHRVFVSDFYLGRFEVTNSQYYKFWVATGPDESNPHTPESFTETGRWPQVVEDKPYYPVVGVSWRDAIAFCAWRNKISRITDTDRAYRLPTEAEWEKAARGVTRQWIYPWGNTWEPVRCNHAVMLVRSGIVPFAGDGYLFTAPVDAYEAQCGKYRLYNMLGNVAEWCMDFYGPEHYKMRMGINPKGSTIGRYRVARGGSYLMNPENMRNSSRLGYNPENRLPYIGFRLARGRGK
jgi:formylglycine-generating enzyme required for sulfatase activity